jgi:integrase
MSKKKQGKAKGVKGDPLCKVTILDGVRIRHLGPARFFIDHRSHGVTKRKSFKTLAEATSYAAQVKVERMNKGVEGFSLTDKQRRDAISAAEILDGVSLVYAATQYRDAMEILGGGVSLADAAREYRRRYPDQSAEALSVTVNRLVDWMRKEGRRDISIREAARKLRLFVQDHPKRATQSIDRQDIAEWIERRGWQGVTAKNYRNAVVTLTNFYHGRMKKRHQRDDKPVTIWPVATVERLFSAAATHEPELIPALAVLFFAGLRPHEMMRLDWSNIDLTGGHIRLEGAQAKTRSARIIDLTPNAKLWLTAYRGQGGLIESEKWYRYARESTMRHAGIKPWPRDVSRHSFASYLYAQRDDAPYVAAQLGHWQGLEMFNRHYRAVVTKADALQYFEIKPKAGKVIRLKATA